MLNQQKEQEGPNHTRKTTLELPVSPTANITNSHNLS